MKESRSRRLDEAAARVVLKNVLRGLAHLHSLRIAHRNLKPENVVFASDSLRTAKLIDFGLAAQLPLHSVPDSDGLLESDEKIGFTDICGTPMYAAPEVMRINANYGLKCDLWSAGILAYEAMIGCFPFPPFSSAAQMFQIIKSGNLDLAGHEGWAGLSEGAKSVITSLLTMDPSARPDAEAALKHPWFNN
eukprot:scaffold2763_cov37-Prasinocladus_malaysianus.AAC.1